MRVNKVLRGERGGLVTKLPGLSTPVLMQWAKVTPSLVFLSFNLFQISAFIDSEKKELCLDKSGQSAGGESAENVAPFSSQMYSLSPHPFWIHSGSFWTEAERPDGGLDSVDIFRLKNILKLCPLISPIIFPAILPVFLTVLWHLFYISVIFTYLGFSQSWEVIWKRPVGSIYLPTFLITTRVSTSVAVSLIG